MPRKKGCETGAALTSKVEKQIHMYIIYNKNNQENMYIERISKHLESLTPRTAKKSKVTKGVSSQIRLESPSFVRILSESHLDVRHSLGASNVVKLSQI